MVLEVVGCCAESLPVTNLAELARKFQEFLSLFGKLRERNEHSELESELWTGLAFGQGPTTTKRYKYV